MAKNITYYRRKAEGVCPGCTGQRDTTNIYCRACIAAKYTTHGIMRAQWIRHDPTIPETALERMWRRRQELEATTPRPAPLEIGHCGRWHAVKRLPFRCPVCQVICLGQ